MIFIDSNVWLYAVSDEPNAGKRQKAIRLLQEANICISSQVINEVLANILKKRIDTEEYASELLEHMYADYMVLKFCTTISELLGNCVGSTNYPYWDSLIVATALRSNADTLYSEDMQDGLNVRNRLIIKNPFQ